MSTPSGPGRGVAIFNKHTPLPRLTVAPITNVRGREREGLSLRLIPWKTTNRAPRLQETTRHSWRLMRHRQ